MVPLEFCPSTRDSRSGEIVQSALELRSPCFSLLLLPGATDPVGEITSGLVDYHHAQSLERSGDFARATSAFVALWQNPSPSMAGVRVSFMLHDIEKLVRQYPPARVRFSEIRDAEAPGAKPIADQLTDWMVLNEALGETSKSVAWFDGRPDLRAVPEYSKTFELRMIPLLVAADRWSDAGNLYRDPLSSLRGTEVGLGRRGILSWAMSLFIGDVQARLFREHAKLMLHALHAAGRDKDAEQVAAEARSVDSSAEMNATIEAALKP